MIDPQNTWMPASTRPAIEGFYLIFGQLEFEPFPRVREAFWNGSEWHSSESGSDGFDNIVEIPLIMVSHWRKMPEKPE